MNLVDVLYRAYEFVKHYSLAGNEHGLHSPFVYGLYNRIIQNHGTPIFDDIDHFYYELLEDNHPILNRNPGAGTTHHAEKLKVKHLASGSIKNLPWRQLLCRLVHERHPKVILELGTSFGITTAYLAETRKDATIYTFEANPTLIHYARSLWKDLGLTNIVLIEGNIDHTLVPTLEKIPTIDVAYMDANHRYEPTMRYAEAILAKMHPESLLIVDDIYWSREMNRAWKQLEARSDISVSIDLWQYGLLYLREGQLKECFKLKY